MKILHTSDWHLGKKLMDFDRLEEQAAVLNEIVEIANNEAVDAVIIAGDLFDTFNPPTLAVELLYKTLKQLTKNGTCPVIALAGNHDSPDRIESPDPLARECGILFVGYPQTLTAEFELESGLKVSKSAKGFLELSLPEHTTPLRIITTPYANELRLRTALDQEKSEAEMREILQQNWQDTADRFCDDRGINLLATHLFVVQNEQEKKEEPEDEKSILHVGGAQAVYTSDIPRQIQYTALGHLHRMHRVPKETAPVFYSGSPLSYSFAEANQDKYTLIVDVEAGKAAEVKPVLLKQGKRLLRKKAENMEEALSWLTENQNALVELTLKTETYLTASDLKTLKECHSGIITIVPEVSSIENTSGEGQKQINLSNSVEELFKDYFTHAKGQAPNDELMELFREINAQ